MKRAAALIGLSALLAGCGSSSSSGGDAGPGPVYEAAMQALGRGDGAGVCERLRPSLLKQAAKPGESTQQTLARCAKEVRSAANKRNAGLRDARVIKVIGRGALADVLIEYRAYGLTIRATGIAQREGGRWRVATFPGDQHAGRMLLLRVPSESMLPAYRVGDVVLVDPDAYETRAPKIGDVVVFRAPAGAAAEVCGSPQVEGQACAKASGKLSDQKFTKRIVAGPGERVALKAGHAYVDGVLRDSAKITACTSNDGCDLPKPITIAAGSYFVLGDNRGASDDSRFWGPVVKRALIGPVVRTLTP